MHYKSTVSLERILGGIILTWSHSIAAPVMMSIFGMLIMGICMKFELNTCQKHCKLVLITHDVE